MVALRGPGGVRPRSDPRSGFLLDGRTDLRTGGVRPRSDPTSRIRLLERLGYDGRLPQAVSPIGAQMTIETLAKEFEHEVGTTRNHLERLPGDKLDWRPHRKSFTVRGLASHIVECVGWADAVFGKAEVDINPATHKAFEAGFDRRIVDRFRRQGRRWETRAGGRHRGRLAAAMATEDSRPGAVRKAEVDRVSRLLPEPPDSPPRTAIRVPAIARRSGARLGTVRPPTINSDAGIARGGALVESR